MKNFADEKLVLMYLNGDEKSLEELIRRYLPLIYNFSRRYSGDADNVSDIVQEVFVKVWKNIKKFDTSRNFKNWILTIAKNTALDWLKRKNAVPFSLLKEYEGDGDFAESIVDTNPLSVIDQLNQKALSHDLRVAVGKLPLKYSSVINLYYNKSLNFREISNLMNQSINTVKSRYRRGLGLLRKILASKDFI